MKLTWSNKPITDAPKGYVRVRLLPEEGTRRLVREGQIELLEIGVGKPKELTRRKFLVLCRAIVAAAKTHKARRIAIAFADAPELWEQLTFTGPEEVCELAATNFVMANYEYRTLKTKPAEGWNEVEEILICDKATSQMRTALTHGQTIGEAVNACRELANTPGGDMTPTRLAKAAKDAVKGLPVSVTTMGRTQIEKLGMGLLAGVARGSSEDPTFTVMTYEGGKGAPIVLAGKGITFDSGGLNLKPSDHIYEMHMDMSGAAAVIHTIALAARLKVKRNVIALIPAAENMPGNNALRPGDVLKSLAGKMVEVTDTDAEGRLVLADAITYAKRLKPAVVIDAATLTGAAMSALGLYASGLFTKDDALAEELVRLGESSGDYVWRLPLWDEFAKGLESDFADLANYPTNRAFRYGGATNGAIFLQEFANELACPFVHLDIAPRMTSAPGDELAKGAAGAPVRLLLSFIESWKA